jgi:hypothetical protein
VTLNYVDAEETRRRLAAEGVAIAEAANQPVLAEAAMTMPAPARV